MTISPLKLCFQIVLLLLTVLLALLSTQNLYYSTTNNNTILTIVDLKCQTGDFLCYDHHRPRRERGIE